MRSFRAWFSVAAALLCAPATEASLADAQGCAIELVDFFVGQLFVETPGNLFHNDEGVARQAVLFALAAPMPASTPAQPGTLGQILRRTPATASAVSSWAIDYDDRLAAHVFGDDARLHDDLLHMPDGWERELANYLAAVGRTRFPLDPGAIYGTGYDLFADEVGPRLHRSAIAHLVSAENESVFRAITLLRMRDLAVRGEPGDPVPEPVMKLALDIVRRARWNDWHRFTPELSRLLREIGWLAKTEREERPPAELALWMSTPENEAFRTFLGTQKAPRPDKFHLRELFKRVAPYVLPAGRTVFADVLDEIAKRHGSRGSTLDYAYLYYDYGAGLFRDTKDAALEAFFARRRDAIAAWAPSVAASLAAARYDAE